MQDRENVEAGIRRQVDAERARLHALSGLDSCPPRHFRRPAERSFRADERGRVTILLGGLTWKHEELLRAVFERAGHRCDLLPAPDTAAYQIGRENGNVGQCNPTYFTVGALIQYLRLLQARGLSREEIIDRYVFFTAGTCGPCRFGMYEAEYRLALQNAGFDGFRVLLFQQNDGVKASSGEPGLRFNVDFGMTALNAFNLGDVIHQSAYRIRPYEVHAGETDRVTHDVVAMLARTLRERERFDLARIVPGWLANAVASRRRLGSVVKTLAEIHHHLYGGAFRDALHDAREAIDRIEVDRLRVKPVVQITGEFWAQTTESDGNFRMFEFLESEGAEVSVDPIGSWVLYLLSQKRMRAAARRGVDSPMTTFWREPRGHMAADLRYLLTRLLFASGERFWTRQYARVADALGSTAHTLPPQDELARLAAPFYNPLARGGEGHLEVGKTLYHSLHRHCHMVLSLKPFGCMPSTQSDGAQSAVAARFKEIVFLPIETAGDGEVHAHSRVQMALAEARLHARREFEAVLGATGKRLDDVRLFVADRPDLRRALYPVPHRDGVTGVAAQFVMHVSALMDRWWRGRSSGLRRAS